MLSAALVEQGLVVAAVASRNGIVHLDDSLCGDEDGAGPQGRVLDVVLLQVTQP